MCSRNSATLYYFPNFPRFLALCLLPLILPSIAFFQRITQNCVFQCINWKQKFHDFRLFPFGLNLPICHLEIYVILFVDEITEFNHYRINTDSESTAISIRYRNRNDYRITIESITVSIQIQNPLTYQYDILTEHK